MNRDDIQKLLGGYATGTLTAEEQQALFEAALDDQELFDALAREQSLRDLLRDPVAKAQLLAALDERPARWYERLGWWRPAAALMVTAGLAAFAVVWVRQTRPNEFAIVVQEQSPVASPMNQPAPAPSKDAPAAGGGVATRQFADAEAPKAKRDQPLADQMNRTAADEKVKAPERAEGGSAVEEDRRAAAPATPSEKKTSLNKEVAAIPSADAATSATPAAPLRSNSVAGFRDSARGGTAGGVTGGVVGGVPGGAPAAPPPPVLRETVQVQATMGSVDGVAPANARDLFYGTPQVQNFVAPPPAAQEQQPAPIQQQQRSQQGQQGQQGQQVVQLGAAAKALQARAVTHVGVRYRLLRQTPGGGFIEADPDSLKTGDTVKVELTANEPGLLSVTSGGRNLFMRQVEKLAVYTTDALKDNERELSVRFARLGPVTVTGTAAFQQRKDEAATNIQPVANERATYVAGDSTSQVVRFTISLKYK